MSAPRDGSSCRSKSTVKRPARKTRKTPRTYDPLHERIVLIQRLCEEYEQWSRLAKDQDKSNPYVAKILALLKETLRDTENLLQRLGLLETRPTSPSVSIDLSLIQQQVGNPDEFVEFVARIGRELAALAVPVSPEDAGELQSEEGGEEEGAGAAVELRERGEPRAEPGEDPRVLPEDDSR